MAICSRPAIRNIICYFGFGQSLRLKQSYYCYCMYN